MSQFKELTQEMTNIKNLLKKEGKKLLEQEFQEVFNLIPDLYAISWTQGTPSFNDGDPCYFSVDEIFAYKSNDNYEEDSAWDIPEDQSKSLDDLVRAFGQNEELLEIIYGNGSKIVIKRTETGIETEVEDWDCGY